MEFFRSVEVVEDIVGKFCIFFFCSFTPTVKDLAGNKEMKRNLILCYDDDDPCRDLARRGSQGFCGGWEVG